MNSRTLLQHLITILLFIFLLAFTYLDLFVEPYRGFSLNSNSLEIISVFHMSPDVEIRTGDQLIRVEETTFEQYQADQHLRLFEGLKPGDQVEIVINRGGELIQLNWTMPPRSMAEFGDRLANVWWLAYIFWAAGLAAVLFIRPVDLRQQLLVAFYYITAIWLMVGSIGWSHIGYSHFIFRSILWFTLPIYCHFHWEFPESIKPIKAIYWLPLYLAAGVMAVIQWLEIPHVNTPITILGFAIIGSLILFFIRYFTNKKSRRDITILGILITLSFLPILVGIILYIFFPPNLTVVIALFSLAGLPVAYFYMAYRKQPGWLEFRANRLITFYFFLMFLLLLTILMALVLAQGEITGFTIPEVLLILFTLTILSIFGFPRIQRWIEKTVLGLPLDRQKIVETYVNRIASSLNRQDLTHLLSNELMPSLQIKQSAVVQLNQNDYEIIHADNVEQDQILTNDWRQYDLNSHTYSYPLRDDNEWIKATIPLKLENHLQGVWLLGRKDPDDTYSNEDFHLLQILGDQTAIALSNILQTELLKKLYTDNINREEEERTALARSLHDEVLNELAALGLNRFDGQQFKTIHTRLVQNIRLMVSGLRPANLDYGLWRALKDLCEEIRERLPHDIGLVFDIQNSAHHYPEQVEIHMLRISQQAIENAVAHAQAQHIWVKGKLNINEIQIIVEDDGIGMGDAANLNLGHLLESKHFGVVGMVERSELIGALLQIETEQGQFTRVILNWSQPED